MPELVRAVTRLPYCPFCKFAMLQCDLHGDQGVNDHPECYCPECGRKFRLPTIELEVLSGPVDRRIVIETDADGLTKVRLPDA